VHLKKRQVKEVLEGHEGESLNEEMVYTPESAFPSLLNDPNMLGEQDIKEIPTP